MDKLIDLYKRVIHGCNNAGEWIGLLLVRILMAYEFGKAGFMKLNGNNWFANIQDNFPFPFNVIPVDISWFIATWFEILGAFGILFGLFTRFWAFSLIILSVVAIFGVHWPDDWGSLAELWKGYAVRNQGFGNYRIPLLFIAMLVPLVFIGPGRLSLDYVLEQRVFNNNGKLAPEAN